MGPILNTKDQFDYRMVDDVVVIPDRRLQVERVERELAAAGGDAEAELAERAAVRVVLAPRRRQRRPHAAQRLARPRTRQLQLLLQQHHYNAES